MSASILAISVFFHILATLFWIGGLLFMSVFVWPETQRVLAENPALYKLLSRFRRRFIPVTNLALVVLVVTGLTQMAGDPNYDGLMQFDNAWSQIILVKHLALVVMVAAGLVLQFGITPALERLSILLERDRGDPTEWARLRRRERLLTWFSLGTGLFIVGLSTWAAAL